MKAKRMKDGKAQNINEEEYKYGKKIRKSRIQNKKEK